MKDAGKFIISGLIGMAVGAALIDMGTTPEYQNESTMSSGGCMESLHNTSLELASNLLMRGDLGSILFAVDVLEKSLSLTSYSTENKRLEVFEKLWFAERCLKEVMACTDSKTKAKCEELSDRIKQLKTKVANTANSTTSSLIDKKWPRKQMLIPRPTPRAAKRIPRARSGLRA